MRFADLQPEWHKYVERMESDPRINGGEPRMARLMIPVRSIAHAQGVWFLCPACFVKNGGPVGTHMVDVTFRGRGVPDNLGSHNRDGAPSRWGVSGAGYADITLEPSVDCGCWHGWVRNGEVTNA